MNLFKIKTAIRRHLNIFFKFEHFSSAPFLSGDTFRSISNHAYDEFSTVTPSAVSDGDVIFVKNNFVRDFFLLIHPQIQSKYILINHNDDTTIDESYVDYVDEKIIHWFGLNIDVRHPKMTPVPIGIENIGYRNKGKLSYLINKELPLQKKDRILVAFNTMNVHRERIDAHKNAHTCDYADILPVISTHNEYVHTVTSYSHILSPRGAGIDCHRTWEALYLGTVPIVKESVLTDYFKSIGVPLIVVKEWSDITNTKHMSELMKIDFPNIDNHPTLYIDFWLNMIHGKRSLLQIEQSRKIM